MKKSNINKAADILAEAHRSGNLIDALPEECQPATLPEALTIQSELISKLGETIAGWKVAPLIDGLVMRGAIIQSRVFTSPAEIAASTMPLLGVEAEIAFIFNRDLGPREAEFTFDEIANAVSPVVAIEIVDSRYKSYTGTNVIHRAADFVSNGGFVCGLPNTKISMSELPHLTATLQVDGETLVSKSGGHIRSHPLLPAVELVNELRLEDGVKRGQFMTTGTFTGLNYVKPGQMVRVEFDGFDPISVTFTA